jgi:hypothetical protein
VVLSEDDGQSRAAQDDVVRRVCRRQRGDPSLEVDQDQGGGRIEGGWH